MNRSVVWVLVATGSEQEAQQIGDAVLAARRASCFDVFPRGLARYFWPPLAGSIEEAAGALLVLETFDGLVEAVQELVRSRHSDQLPFMGSIRIEHVDPRYRAWMDGELNKED